MRVAILAFVAFSFSSLLTAQNTPKLLLTPQRLRRLQRDRERQTARWTNFENRIESVLDSPQRGFELALYYAVTHDETRGREAIQWALAHRCDRRQTALVIDWCAGLLSESERQQLTSASCEETQLNPADRVRDAFFLAVARDGSGSTDGWKDLLSWLEAGNFERGDVLYAVCEYLAAVRATEHVDLREDAREFFSGLPAEVLLALKPSELEHPNWITHIAALALVSLDPNLEGSQYLQGWAMESAQTIREGPGVAYEFLWADPYLPGVGYQNLDPWVYDPQGRLFARTGWQADACWVAVSTHGTEEQNCPPGWQNSATTIGYMTLMPLKPHCIDAPPRKTANEAAVIWKLQPQEPIFFFMEGRVDSARADGAGMWRVPSNVAGKVCTSLDTLKLPPAHISVRKR